MSKMKPLEMLFTTILHSDINDQVSIMSRVQKEWFENQPESKLFLAGASILKRNKTIDLVEMAKEFKNNGWYNKQSIIQMSNLANRDYRLSNIVNLDNLLNAIYEQHIIMIAARTKSHIENLILNGNFTVEAYKKIIKSSYKAKINTDKAVSLDTVVNTVLDKHDKASRGDLGGIELGYQTLKQVVLLEPVDLMIVGARPSMGKTAFAVNTAIRMAYEGKKIVFFALEMSKLQIMRRIIANVAEVDSNKIKYGTCSDQELNTISSVRNLDFLNNIKLYDGSQTLNTISSIINDHKSSEECDFVIIDYLQKIQTPDSKSRYEGVTENSNGVKLLCQNLKIPILALAQLSRDSGRGGKRPTLPDIRESGEIEQDASIVGFLHRPEYYGEEITYNGNDSKDVCEFIVAKNREGEIGVYDMRVDLKFSKFIG